MSWNRKSGQDTGSTPDDGRSQESGGSLEAARPTPPQWAVILLEELGDTVADAVADGVAEAIKTTVEIATGNGSEQPGAPAKATYRNAVQWVQKWLAPQTVRPDRGNIKWCPCWWDHPEVLSRVEGLWETWEQTRSSATSRLEWWQTHFDHHWPVITSPTGPMHHCTRDQHNGPGRALQSDPPGEGHFGDEQPAS